LPVTLRPVTVGGDMSILDSLLRFIDPVQHRQQQEDRRRKREALPPDVDEDEVDVVAPRATKAPAMQCRICHHEGTGQFCPTCLAQTMVPLRARREK
jgi:hypothetical protein